MGGKSLIEQCRARKKATGVKNIFYGLRTIDSICGLEIRKTRKQTRGKTIDESKYKRKKTTTKARQNFKTEHTDAHTNHYKKAPYGNIDKVQKSYNKKAPILGRKSSSQETSIRKKEYR